MKTPRQYKIAPSCAFEYFEDERSTIYVVCTAPGSVARVLSGTGTLIWQGLTDEFQDAQKIATTIAQKNGISASEITDDVRQFLLILEESGLLNVK